MHHCLIYLGVTKISKVDNALPFNSNAYLFILQVLRV